MQNPFILASQYAPYPPEAFEFLFEALNDIEIRKTISPLHPPHLTGQELCHGLRKYAQFRYGDLARATWEYWGVKSTDDWGVMVYTCIDLNLMNKTPTDSQEDFNSVFEFSTVFNPMPIRILSENRDEE